MAIEMQEQSGRFGPILVCDECGERIATVSDGIVMWFAPSPSERIKCYHLHRRKCQFLAEQKLRGTQVTMTAELDVHLFFLLHNTHYDAKKAQESAELVEQF